MLYSLDRLWGLLDASRKHYAVIVAHPYVAAPVVRKLFPSYTMEHIDYQDLYLLVTPDGSVWYGKTGGSMLLPMPPGYEPVARTVPGGYVVGFRAETPRGTIVLLYDTLDPRGSFTNQAIMSGLRAGLDPRGVLGDLLRYAGASPGDTLLAPEGLAFNYTLPEDAPIPVAELNIRRIVAGALAELLSVEAEVLPEVGRAALPVIALLVLGGLYLAGTRSLRGLSAERPGPPEPLESHRPVDTVSLSLAYLETLRLARKGRPSRAQAAAMIRGLYSLLDWLVSRRYGVGLEEALVRDDIIEDMARGSGLDPGELRSLMERLVIVYKRKVAGSSIFPLVRLPREAVRLARGLQPVLEYLGLRLPSGGRGGKGGGGGG